MIGVQSSLALFASAPVAPTPESQCAEILAALKAGDRLTPGDGLRRFGTSRLAARIFDLRRKGHAIKDEWLKVGPHCTVKRYFMEAN